MEGSDGEEYFDLDEYEDQFDYPDSLPVFLYPEEGGYSAHKQKHLNTKGQQQAEIVPLETVKQLDENTIAWCDDCFPRDATGHGYNMIFDDVDDQD